MGTILLASAIVLNVTANTLFKFAATIPDLSTRKMSLAAVGLLLGLGNTLCFIKALEQLDLGVAYAIFSSASIVLIALVSPHVFGEEMSTQKVIGLVTICVGLFLTWRA